MQEHWGIASSHQSQVDSTLFSLCSSIVFPQAPILLQQQEISLQPIWFMYTGSGASARRRRNPLVAAGWLDDYSARQRLAPETSWSVSTSPSPVGWLRNAAKSTLSISSWHLPRPKRLKMSNVSLLAKTNQNWILLIVFILEQIQTPEGAHLLCPVEVKRTFFFKKKMQEEIAIEIQGGRVANRPVWVVGWTTKYVQSSLYISIDIL